MGLILKLYFKIAARFKLGTSEDLLKCESSGRFTQVKYT